MMNRAVVYARVSSKDQEREGFSIPAQLKLLCEYANSHDFEIVREFVEVETAKVAGRKKFAEMVRFFKQTPSCRILIVEKTDRLYRNLRDCVTLEDLEIEIHLPKEGQIISKDSNSPAKLMHGIRVVMARNYIDNLSEEVRKGMREKAEQGIYPSRPPIGYTNNKLSHTIEVDSHKAPLARRMFELYATGNFSLSSLRQTIKAEFGQQMAKGYLERLLKNPFYTGLFIWDGKTYKGTQTPLVTADRFEQVQAVFRGHNKPKYQKHEFAFRGLLTCAYDDCLVTAEIKKGKYTYYHCTGHRGKCALPYFPEEALGERLGQILKDIHIPDDVLAKLKSSLLADRSGRDSTFKQQKERLNERLGLVRRRIEQMYLDKLDGKVSEELWLRKSAEWQQEEQRVMMAMQGLENASPDRILDGARILELANKAHFLYLRQTSAEKAALLKMVLSNCAVDAASIYPTYRKPFDLIFAQGQNGGWRARRDSNSRPSGSKPDALSS
jgi:site-specific DNA recombinase